MENATITKTDLIDSIIAKIDEFGLANVVGETTTVLVNKRDYSDVEVADTDFACFTEAHATMARFLVEYDDDRVRIDRSLVRSWVESFDREI